MKLTIKKLRVVDGNVFLVHLDREVKVNVILILMLKVSSYYHQNLTKLNKMHMTFLCKDPYFNRRLNNMLKLFLKLQHLDK